MAYIQSNPPPPNKVLSFSLQQFTGGLNNRSHILEAHQATDLMNMAFADDVVMEKRKGSTYFDTLTLNGEVVFLDEYRPYTDDDIIVRATATELYFGNIKIMDIQNPISGVNYRGRYYFCDGHKMYVYGRFPQATSTYEDVRGTVTNNYVVMQMVNPPVGFTPLPDPHFKGKTIFDYNNRQVWYEPCNFEMTDTYKNANVLPESPRFMVSHKGRIFASGSDKDNDNVFITDIHNPFYFPTALPIQLPPNSDRVVGLHVYDDSVVVGRREDVYAITGDTNRMDMGVPTFRLEKINTHTGFASGKAVDVANNYLFYLGTDGNAYSMTNAQGTEAQLVTSILSKTIDITKHPINLTKQDLYEAASIFFDDKWYVSMKDKVLVYSYRHQSWSVYDGLHARCFFNFHGVILWGNKDGRVSLPSEGYLDYGAPYRAYWTSKNFDMDDANSFKQFKEFFIVAHTFDEMKSDINVTFEVDHVDVDAKVIITNQKSIWGRALFGERFITRNVNISYPFALGRRGRGMKFTFSNGYELLPAIETASLLDTVTGRRTGTAIYVTDEQKYYVFTETGWTLAADSVVNQPMRVYQVNGDYEIRGKR